MQGREHASVLIFQSNTSKADYIPTPDLCTHLGSGVMDKLNACEVLFPAEETDGKPRAEYGQTKHHKDRQQDIFHLTSDKRIFHHCDTLCQRKYADNFLHHGRHDLNRNRRTGKDQHRKIEDGRDDTSLFGVLRDAAQ